MIVDGQVVGAVADGIGGAMFSEMIYDADGQPLTGSLADYLVATAPEVPRIRVLACRFPFEHKSVRRSRASAREGSFRLRLRSPMRWRAPSILCAPATKSRSLLIDASSPHVNADREIRGTSAPAKRRGLRSRTVQAK